LQLLGGNHFNIWVSWWRGKSVTLFRS